MSEKQMRVYIAGPMAKGVFAQNMRWAMDAANEIITKGHYPFIPHLFWYLEVIHHRPAEQWLDLDHTWLLQCDAIYRIPGASIGADMEVKWAEKYDLAIYHHLDEIPFVELEYREALPVYKSP